VPLGVPRIFDSLHNRPAAVTCASGNSLVVDIYNSQTRGWTPARLSVQRTVLAAASVGNLAMFAGGWTGSALTSVVDVFDSTTQLWTTDRLTQSRSFLSAASVGNIAMFAGGSLRNILARARSDALNHLYALVQGLVGLMLLIFTTSQHAHGRQPD
jgi:hypothetical protein